MERRALVQWVVYDHPADFRHVYVARKWVIAPGKEPEKTDDLIVHRELEPIREHLERLGLACIPRFADDDPVIVEVWM